MRHGRGRHARKPKPKPKPKLSKAYTRSRSPKPLVHELPLLMVIAIVLALLIKTFVMQAFFIPSGSMEQTLRVGDRVVVNKLVYRFRDINRGDIVVFDGLDSFVADSDLRVDAPATNPVQRLVRGLRELVGVGGPSEKDFIKRVIAVPGDKVACCTDGHVVVNGAPLNEVGYVFEDGKEPFAEQTILPGKIWVMGDHRSQSSDSRVNGQVPESRVIGRAVVVVWPLGRLRGLRSPATFENRPRVTPAGLATSPLALSTAFVGLGSGVRRRRRRDAVR
ncbi:MAG: signal peptidase I [Mycobacteriales bacterium]